MFSLDCRVCGASVGFSSLTAFSVGFSSGLSSAMLYLPFSQLIAEDVAIWTIR